MKLFTLKIATIFSMFSAYGQKTFSLQSGIQNQSLSINGISYEIGNSTIKIPTNYPKFDTLVFGRFNDSGEVRPIICNFKPDSTYAVFLGCCNQPDIAPLSKLERDSLKYWQWEVDQLRDRPFISVRTINKTKDSIFAWLVDFGCAPLFSAISIIPWKLGVPPKCAYWSNITTILFFTRGNSAVKNEPDDIEMFLEIPEVERLAEVSFRLFDNQKFMLVYDEKKRSVELQYE